MRVEYCALGDFNELKEKIFYKISIMNKYEFAEIIFLITLGIILFTVLKIK